jgi:tetratricopeptide (TPR) repeat protein
MKQLKLDEIRRALPALDELRPVLDFLMTRSTPDPSREWSRSGEVDTVGQRLVPGDAVAGSAEELAREEQEHLRAIYRFMGQAIVHLASGDGNSAATALLEAGALEEARDRPDRAEAYATSAYHAARDERDQRSAALALRRWARAARTQGRLDDACSRYGEAFRIAQATFDVRGAAEAAIGAGNSLEEQGRWLEAERWYRRALEIVEDVESPLPERWQAMLNLHITLRSRGAVEESLTWLRDAEAAAHAAGEDGAAPFLENARGQLHIYTGELGRAEQHLRRALEAATALGATVTIRLNLAEALLAQGRSLEAAEEARQAEREALVGGVAPRLPEVYRLLGRIAATEGNPDAFSLFERALEIIKERGLPVLEEARTLQAYAQFEAEWGEEETARQLHEQASERYRAVGLDHMRHPWTDVHEPDPSDGGEPPHGNDGEDHV